MYEREKLIGTIENVRYRNDENGYSVLEMQGEDGMCFIAVGIIPMPEAGETVELCGVWTEHKTYGEQFRVDSYSIIAPTELSDIENYLANGTIKGIGHSVARMIVEKFGSSTLEVLDNTPERLLEIPGIGRKKLAQITESYNKQRMNRGLMMEMQKLDITPAMASHIFARYGDEAVNVIRSNPYRLIEEVQGIGFKTADKIAQRAGISYNSSFRIRAGIRFILEWAKQEGHTYLPYDVLISATVKTIGVSEEETERELTGLLAVKSLVDNICDDRRVVFLPYMRRAEMSIASALIDIDRSAKPILDFDIAEETERAAEKQKLTPAPMQKEALAQMFRKGVVIITGGPGTGKTTILRLAIDIMKKRNISFELCAPTGRAAKRMGLATGEQAQTLHRLLEYSLADQSFMRDEDNPLEADFVIVDEMSMVDVQLMDALLKAVTKETRLVLVGDADQLPSVGAGNVLKDILESGEICAVKLHEIYRQAQQSMIIANAHRINNGIQPVLSDYSSDFNFYPMYDAEQTKSDIVSIFTGKAKNIFRTDDVQNNVQVLSPVKKGALGVNSLNYCLQNALNPKDDYKPEIQHGETTFRLGDKVMQIKNNYSVEWSREENGIITEEGRGVFNGDIGRITNVDTRNRILEVQFESGYTAEYTHDGFDELSLAYCISIHKSQGSEFPAVLIVIPNTAPSFLTRNLLYTAVTRAREQVCIFSSEYTVNAMVNNKSTKSRYTALKSIIREYSERFAEND